MSTAKHKRTTINTAMANNNDSNNNKLIDIRSFKPEDAEICRLMFIQGLQQLFPRCFLKCLYSPQFLTIYICSITTSYVFYSYYLILALIFIAPVLSFIKMRIAFNSYGNDALNEDLDKI